MIPFWMSEYQNVSKLKSSINLFRKQMLSNQLEYKIRNEAEEAKTNFRESGFYDRCNQQEGQVPSTLT